MSLPCCVPKTIRDAVEGYSWYTVTAGMSTASIWRLERRGSASLYAKKDRSEFPDELAHERSVIEWLAGRLSAPRVVAEGTASGARWLAYGVTKVERDKVRFYRLLDEFF